MKIIKILIPLLSVFFLLSSTISGNAQTDDQSAYYLIQPGDTLGSISNKFDISEEDLIFANNILDPNFISPGDRLLIPNLVGISGLITPVVLNIGETLDSITRFYGVDAQKLISLNKITALTNIIAGSTILVPIKENTLIETNTINYYSTQFTLLESSVKLDTTIEKIESTNHIASILPLIGNQRLSIDNLNLDSQPENPAIENIHISLSPLPLIQGTTMSLRVSSPMPITISGSINGSNLNFYTENNMDIFALQGIQALSEPGVSVFELSIQTEEGTLVNYEQSILIQSGFFTTDPPLFVDPETIDPQNTASEEILINELVANFTEEKYWSGIFNSPAYYQEYTSLFGNRRTYNDDPKISFHSGLDFGGGVTLPIVAPADGKVVFSRFLPIRGNAIFIDHGLGVYTGYFHQSLLEVAEGEFVTAGQKIGEVGNTGRVSNGTDYPGAGAHLHWEVWVNGVQVNPLDWLNQKYPE